MSLKAHKKVSAKEVMSAPNVIPMADIMLVLLIIFMVVTPMLQKGTPVDMARVANPEDLEDADKDDAVIVAVTRDGVLFIGNTKTELDVVASQVRDLITGRMDKTVYIRSDARAKYGVVVKVVDEVRSAGVDNVGLLTDKIESAEPTLPPPAD